MNNFEMFLALLISSFLTTFAFLKIIIPYMVSKKVGQTILKEGPIWHENKNGTPTMGGIGFILGFLFCFLIYAVFSYQKIDLQEIKFAFLVIIYALANALIGLVDDALKVSKKENKGLSAKTKFALQAVASILFLILIKTGIGVDTLVSLPLTSTQIDIGFLYYPIAFFLLCGFVNSVNLTDGIDGLASGVALPIAIFFLLLSFTIADNSLLVYFGSTLLGCIVAFFIFNAHPAKIFMGDTGSLFLGALIVGVSFLIDNIFLVLIYGGVYVIEAISVVLQVVYFKLSKGKRIFKMAPLHHHFEKIGWNENKIVFYFSLVSLLLCIIAFLGLVL